jgi:pimeloyl-ACP methyl ester carboxylesterase
MLEAGAGGRPMLLLHGAGARADRWARNIGPLAEAGFHVHAVDFPGHGFASKGPDVECSVPAYANMVVGLLDEVGVDSAIIVGTSLGGHVAGMVALQHPDRVAALVLVGATGLFPQGAERRRRTAARLRDTTPEGIGEKLRAVLHDPACVTDEWIAEEHRVNTSPGARESIERLARYFEDGLDEEPVGEGLAGSSMDMLLVWGVEDTLVPVETGRAAAALLGKPLVEIEQAGHAPYFERPEAFHTAVIAHLSPDPSIGQRPARRTP